LIVLFVEKTPTGRDLADVKFWATTCVERAARGINDDEAWLNPLMEKKMTEKVDSFFTTNN